MQVGVPRSRTLAVSEVRTLEKLLYPLAGCQAVAEDVHLAVEKEGPAEVGKGRGV